jgi:hypothetical protein
VNSFHEVGLPNHLRGQTPNGLVDYEYRRGDEVILAGMSSFGAVGDITLTRRTLYERRARARRGKLKLPTGTHRTSAEAVHRLRSGVAFDRIGPKYGLYLNANTTSSEPLSASRPGLLLFMAGADWRFKPALAAVLQSIHAAADPGELLNLNDPGIQVALGIRYHHSAGFAYEWRLVEDLSSFSPDFTFAFQMEVRSKGGR